MAAAAQEHAHVAKVDGVDLDDVELEACRECTLLRMQPCVTLRLRRQRRCPGRVEPGRRGQRGRGGRCGRARHARRRGFGPGGPAHALLL